MTWFCAPILNGENNAIVHICEPFSVGAHILNEVPLIRVTQCIWFLSLNIYAKSVWLLRNALAHAKHTHTLVNYVNVKAFDFSIFIKSEWIIPHKEWREPANGQHSQPFTKKKCHAFDVNYLINDHIFIIPYELTNSTLSKLSGMIWSLGRSCTQHIIP